MSLISKYSYGFYVYHDLFTNARIAYFVWCMAIFHSMLIAGLVYASSSYLITLLVAGLSYELYEKRFLAMKSRFQYEPWETRSDESASVATRSTGRAI